jgi:hypothetical protein
MTHLNGAKLTQLPDARVICHTSALRSGASTTPRGLKLTVYTMQAALILQEDFPSPRSVRAPLNWRQCAVRTAEACNLP